MLDLLCAEFGQLVREDGVYEFVDCSGGLVGIKVFSIFFFIKHRGKNSRRNSQDPRSKKLFISLIKQAELFH